MRELTIKISIEEDNPRGCHVLAQERSSDGVYNIVLSEKQIKEQKLNPAQVISHEIGHALGYKSEQSYADLINVLRTAT